MKLPFIGLSRSGAHVDVVWLVAAAFAGAGVCQDLCGVATEPGTLRHLLHVAIPSSNLLGGNGRRSGLASIGEPDRTATWGYQQARSESIKAGRRRWDLELASTSSPGPQVGEFAAKAGMEPNGGLPGPSKRPKPGGARAGLQ